MKTKEHMKPYILFFAMVGIAAAIMSVIFLFLGQFQREWSNSVILMIVSFCVVKLLKMVAKEDL